MAKIGRNDPCPCGSGKKYKHCCLRKEQVAQRDTLRLRRARDTLPQELWQFAIQQRFNADLTAALGLFWNNRYQPRDLAYIPPELRWRFMDWYIHDFRTSQGRKTPAELFTIERSADLQPAEREVLQARIESVLSIYQVVEVPEKETGYLQLKDILQGNGGPIQRSPSFDLQKGDLFWSRLISIRGIYVPVSISILLPSEVVADLETLMDHHFERYQEAHYGASRRAFLKDSGHLFNHYFMDAFEEEVATEHRLSDEEVARGIARQLEGQIIVGSMEQHYERWLDTPIPVWDGQSPRRLITTEQGRQRMLLLLDELERMEDRKRLSGQPFYEVDRLREKLGLTPMGEVLTSGGPVIYRPW